METRLLHISTPPIGVGQERACYRHPDDADKAIKLQVGSVDKQTRREIDFYRWLDRRGMRNFDHIPRFYGHVMTNLGRGFVVDLIRNYDGEISKSLYWHFERGYPLSEFNHYLDELRQYLLRNRVVFSVDMGRFNVLFNKRSATEARLVIIDGLGNHSAINWLDAVAYFSRRKIERRWQRFYNRLQTYSAEMMRDFNGNPQNLDAAYRRLD